MENFTQKEKIVKINPIELFKFNNNLLDSNMKASEEYLASENAFSSSPCVAENEITKLLKTMRKLSDNKETPDRDIKNPSFTCEETSRDLNLPLKTYQASHKTALGSGSFQNNLGEDLRQKLRQQRETRNERHVQEHSQLGDLSSDEEMSPAGEEEFEEVRVISYILSEDEKSDESVVSRVLEAPKLKRAEKKKAMRPKVCNVCKVPLPRGAEAMLMHRQGRRHKVMVSKEGRGRGADCKDFTAELEDISRKIHDAKKNKSMINHVDCNSSIKLTKINEIVWDL